MKVGVLGSGIVGRVLGSGFVKHGHQVMMGTRDPDAKEVREWLNKTAGASAGSFAEAARFGEFIVLVVLGRIVDRVIELAGPENFKGKTVMDATNPLADSPPVNGVLLYTTGPNESLGEKIQSLLPEVIGMNTFGASAPLKALQKKFVFEPNEVVAAAKEQLKKN